MGLFGKDKESEQDRGDKLAELSVEYIGGYGDQKKDKGTLTFYQKQTEFKNPRHNKKLWFTIDNTKVSEVAIEGKEEIRRRVTFTRVLALGVFALAFKKKSKDKEAYVTLELSDGNEVVFHVENQSPIELKASLSKALPLFKQAGRPTLSNSSSVADELTKLAKLKQQGVITQSEFEKQKSQLLKL